MAGIAAVAIEISPPKNRLAHQSSDKYGTIPLACTPSRPKRGRRQIKSERAPPPRVLRACSPVHACYLSTTNTRCRPLTSNPVQQNSRSRRLNHTSHRAVCVRPCLHTSYTSTANSACQPFVGDTTQRGASRHRLCRHSRHAVWLPLCLHATHSS